VRATLVVCLTVILSGLGNTQAGGDPERIIRRIVDDGISEGHDQKVIGRLGDASAVLITKILSDKNLTSKTIDNVLVVLEGSFAEPALVAIASDREPRTALLLLRYLYISASDTGLKRRIADTRKHIEAHTGEGFAEP
jgi:hypothetical protein